MVVYDNNIFKMCFPGVIDYLIYYRYVDGKTLRISSRKIKNTELYDSIFSIEESLEDKLHRIISEVSLAVEKIIGRSKVLNIIKITSLRKYVVDSGEYEFKDISDFLIKIIGALCCYNAKSLPIAMNLREEIKLIYIDFLKKYIYKDEKDANDYELSFFNRFSDEISKKSNKRLFALRASKFDDIANSSDILLFFMDRFGISHIIASIDIKNNEIYGLKRKFVSVFDCIKVVKDSKNVKVVRYKKDFIPSFLIYVYNVEYYGKFIREIYEYLNYKSEAEAIDDDSSDFMVTSIVVDMLNNKYCNKRITR